MPVRIPTDHPAISLRGWCDTRDPSFVGMVWSGTGFSSTLRGGGEVLVDLSGRGMVEVRLDGRIVATLGPELEPFHLSLGEDGHAHELVVEKTTEPVAGVATFRGLSAEPGISLSPAPAPAGPRLLFLGDSLTCGYGVLAEDASEGFSARTESVRHSFAGVATAALGASAQYSAWSGKGFQENFDRTRSKVLPDLWRLADPFDPGSAVAEPSRPDLVLVNLGSNDVFHADPDWTAFTDAAISLGHDLRATFPGVPLLYLDGPAITDETLRDSAGRPRPLLSRVRAALDEAVSALAPSGPALRFSLPSCRPDEPHGADHHPGLERQRLAGVALARFLEGLALPGVAARA